MPSKKTLAFLLALASAGLFTNFLNHRLYEKFPDYDQKVVRQAFRRMVGRALLDQYNPPFNQRSDEEIDILFHTEVMDILMK